MRTALRVSPHAQVGAQAIGAISSDGPTIDSTRSTIATVPHRMRNPRSPRGIEQFAPHQHERQQERDQAEVRTGDDDHAAHELVVEVVQHRRHPIATISTTATAMASPSPLRMT